MFTATWLGLYYRPWCGKITKSARAALDPRLDHWRRAGLLASFLLLKRAHILNYYRSWSRGDNTFGSIRLSICLSVCPSVRLFVCWCSPAFFSVGVQNGCCKRNYCKPYHAYGIVLYAFPVMNNLFIAIYFKFTCCKHHAVQNFLRAVIPFADSVT